MRKCAYPSILKKRKNSLKRFARSALILGINVRSGRGVEASDTQNVIEMHFLIKMDLEASYPLSRNKSVRHRIHGKGRDFRIVHMIILIKV